MIFYDKLGFKIKLKKSQVVLTQNPNFCARHKLFTKKIEEPRIQLRKTFALILRNYWLCIYLLGSFRDYFIDKYVKNIFRQPGKNNDNKQNKYQ